MTYDSFWCNGRIKKKRKREDVMNAFFNTSMAVLQSCECKKFYSDLAEIISQKRNYNAAPRQTEEK